MVRRAAIVLAGGRSRRMGQPKAWLRLGEHTLLERIIATLEPPLVQCRIVVGAAGQELPCLPPDVMTAVDQHVDRGPLEGLRAGLLAGAGLADVFYASSCDVPLLKREFVERLFQLMQPDDQIVVPRDAQHFHPLAAVYRADVLPLVSELLAADRLRPYFLLEKAATRVIDVEQLREVDPQLDSLRNLNTPEDYQRVMRQC